MVRLKETIFNDIQTILLHFNSNMVRLKVFLFFLPFLRNSYFNSNMVRLKAQINTFLPGISKFQFQYGSIKSDVETDLSLDPI